MNVLYFCVKNNFYYLLFNDLGFCRVQLASDVRMFHAACGSKSFPPRFSLMGLTATSSNVFSASPLFFSNSQDIVRKIPKVALEITS